jgi:hypothetical protein
MRSTWHARSRDTWNGAQRMLSRVQPARVSPQPALRAACGAKVPVLRVRDQWMWVLPRAVLPLIVHGRAQTLLALELGPVAAFVFYGKCTPSAARHTSHVTPRTSHISLSCTQRWRSSCSARAPCRP